MKILSFKERETEEITLLLGNFDGLHIGHKTLIDCAKSFKHKLAIVTFVNLYKKGYIKSLDERLLEYERLGFDYTIVLDYNEICSLDGNNFLSALVERFNIKHIVCGEDFTYGRYALQSADDIECFAFSNNIACSILPSFSIKNQRMSSSYVKELIKEGKIELINKLLLENYSICSTVVHGNRLGKTLGFPTMNFNLDPQKVELKNGVYLIYTYVDGKKYYGISNFGLKPTIGDFEKNFEVHLLDFCQEMYGKKIEIFFLKLIRETVKFDSIEDLKLQIMLDIKHAREIIEQVDKVG